MATTRTVLRPTPGGEDFDTILDGLKAGLEEEIRAVYQDLQRWGGHEPAEIAGGHYEGQEEYYLYRVETKRPLYAPEHTGVAVEAGSDRTRGWVDEVEDDGRAMWLMLDERLKDDLTDYTLSFDPTFVLTSMLNQLEALHREASHPGRPMVERLFGLRPANIGIGASLPKPMQAELNRDQRVLVQTIEASDLVVGFGPPGTGKTRTGAAAVAHLADTLGLRVLVTAHTNHALDTLMAAIVDRLPDWVVEGRIVRSGRLTRDHSHLGIGYQDFQERAFQEHAAEMNRALTALEIRAADLLPAPEAPSHDDRFAAFRARKAKQRKGRSKSASGRWKARLGQLAERLHAARQSGDATREVDRLASDVEDLAEQIRKGAGQPEQTAQIVGATFSKLAVEPEAFNRYDVVIADEASMAMLAQMALATQLADRKVVVLGDGRQLPPIVQSRGPAGQEWLKRNVYLQLGLDDPTTDDPRCVLLRTQYRMAPAIRTVVSETFYGGLLKDAPELADRTGPVELRLVDTSEYGSIDLVDGEPTLLANRSEKSGRSRVNVAHADLIAQLIDDLHLEGESDIAVITPFNAQSKQIREALRSRGISRGFWAGGGSVSTIHRAQGGERDVVILDTVDAPAPGGGTRGMSSFMDASWNRDLPQLINVAISRARRRLIVVAHTAGYRRKYGRGTLLFELLARVYKEGSYDKVPPPDPDTDGPGSGARGKTRIQRTLKI